MDEKDFQIGDSVMWQNDPEEAGIVTKKSDTAVFIEWDHCESGWIDNRDLQNVSIWREYDQHPLA